MPLYAMRQNNGYSESGWTRSNTYTETIISTTWQVICGSCSWKVVKEHQVYQTLEKWAFTLFSFPIHLMGPLRIAIKDRSSRAELATPMIHPAEITLKGGGYTSGQIFYELSDPDSATHSSNLIVSITVWVAQTFLKNPCKDSPRLWISWKAP